MNLNVLLLGNEDIKQSKKIIYDLNSFVIKLNSEYQVSSDFVEQVNMDDANTLYLCYPSLKMDLEEQMTKRIVLMCVVYPFYDLYINKFKFAAYKTPDEKPFLYGQKEIIEKAGLECWGARSAYDRIGVYPNQDWIKVLIQYLRIYLKGL